MTDLGRRQVRAVGKKLLRNFQFCRVFASKSDRAIEIAQIVSGRQGVISKESLGFSDLLPTREIKGAKKIRAAKWKAGGIVTIGDWESWAPEYYAAVRKHFGQAVLGAAIESAEECGNCSILIGNHSPLLELLIDDPSTPTIGVAGIVVYTIQVDNGSAKIVNSEVLFKGWRLKW